jgi:hypothetical protein
MRHGGVFVLSLVVVIFDSVGMTDLGDLVVRVVGVLVGWCRRELVTYVCCQKCWHWKTKKLVQKSYSENPVITKFVNRK